MKCPNCQCEITENYVFCKNCGAELKGTNKSVVELNNINYKRRNSHSWLIVGIIVFLLMATFIGTIIYFIKYDEDHPKQTYENKQTKDIREKQETKQVKFKGYLFNIPSKMETNLADDKLFIHGENNEWVGIVMMKEMKYETILSAKNEIKDYIAKQNIVENYNLTNTITEENEYNGKKFLITKGVMSGAYYLDISYSKADESNIYAISLTKNDGTELSEAERASFYTVISSSKKGA